MSTGASPRALYPEIEPYQYGYLDTTDGHRVLQRAWPCAELVVVPDAGHLADHPGLTGELIRATDRFAARIS